MYEIGQARRRKGFTQERLAELMETRQSRVSAWENGKPPNKENARKLSELLDLPLESILFPRQVGETVTQ